MNDTKLYQQIIDHLSEEIKKKTELDYIRLSSQNPTQQPRLFS